jgi:hypothetical protein
MQIGHTSFMAAMHVVGVAPSVRRTLEPGPIRQLKPNAFKEDEKYKEL